MEQRLHREELKAEQTFMHRAGIALHPARLVLLIVILFLLFILDIAAGSVAIPPLDILRVMTGGEAAKESWEKIVLVFRLPKALAAVSAGAALAVSGLMMQTLFRNPLAGPFVLGINSGASLGVALTVLAVGTFSTNTMLAGLGLIGSLGLVLSASIGSSLVLFLVLFVSRKLRNVMTLLIMGLLFGYAANALVSILMHFSSAERVQAYMLWTFGSFSSLTWDKMTIFLPVIGAGLLMTIALVKVLDGLLLGEHYAHSLGLRVKTARVFIIVITALLSGTVTAFCGPVGFIGIAIPHLARSIFNTSNHRILLPTTVLLGAIAALVADIVAQLPGSSAVLPLNAVTAIIGAPVVAWVILRRRNLKENFAS
jgi:iron complex transport system permease protein